MPDAAFCCPMRARFIVGIKGERLDQPVPPPTVLMDFVRDWGGRTPGDKIVLNFIYCPFCGKPRAPDARVEVV